VYKDFYKNFGAIANVRNKLFVKAV